MKTQTQAERKVDLCSEESVNKEASIGVVCGGRHISLHEMRNKQQQEKCQEPMNRCRPEKIDTKEH